MFPVILGIAAVALLIASSRKASAQTPRLAASPQPLPLPQPAPTPAETAANNIRGGAGTAEDYETVADEAERQGLPDVADQLSDRADAAPARPPVAPPAALPAPARPPAVVPMPQLPFVPSPIVPVRPVVPVRPPVVPVLPAPVVPAAPAPAAPIILPGGFDPVVARRLSSAVNRDIKNRRYNYSRRGLKAFQVAAGIENDGIYGNNAWGAMTFYLPRGRAARALFRPTSPTTYPENLALAAVNALENQ